MAPTILTKFAGMHEQHEMPKGTKIPTMNKSDVWVVVLQAHRPLSAVTSFSCSGSGNTTFSSCPSSVNTASLSGNDIGSIVAGCSDEGKGAKYGRVSTH